MSGYSPEEQEVLAAVGEGHGQRRHLMDIYCYTQTFDSPQDVGRILRELLHRGIILRQKNEAGKFCYWKPKGDEVMEIGVGTVEEKPAEVKVGKKRRGPAPGFKRKPKVKPEEKAAPAAAREITIQHFRAGLFTDGCLIMDMPGVGRLELTQQETRRIARLFRRGK